MTGGVCYRGYPFRLAAARQATFPKGTAFRGGGKLSGIANGYPPLEKRLPRIGEDVASGDKRGNLARERLRGRWQNPDGLCLRK